VVSRDILINIVPAWQPRANQKQKLLICPDDHIWTYFTLFGHVGKKYFWCDKLFLKTCTGQEHMDSQDIYYLLISEPLTTPLLNTLKKKPLVVDSKRQGLSTINFALIIRLWTRYRRCCLHSNRHVYIYHHRANMGVPVAILTILTPMNAQQHMMSCPIMYCTPIATAREHFNFFWIICKYSADNLDMAIAAATRNGRNTWIAP